MPRKKGDNLTMREKLRITGKREAPNLPKITKDNFDLKIFELIKMPKWSVREAAHYLNEEIPNTSISPTIAQKIERERFWIQKTMGFGTSEDVSDNIYESPGYFFRLMWENSRIFPLELWSMYFEWDQGRIGVDIPINLNRSRYRNAAKMTWEVCPNTSVEKMTEFLRLLSFRAKDKEGFPLLIPRSCATIFDYIKKDAKLNKGRPRSINEKSIFDLNEELITLIEQKIG